VGGEGKGGGGELSLGEEEKNSTIVFKKGKKRTEGWAVFIYFCARKRGKKKKKNIAGKEGTYRLTA